MKMKIKVMINGFGRIGRLALRALLESNRDDIEVVAINNKRGAEAASYLYKYDSVHGIATKNVEWADDWMDVGLGKIKVFSTYDISSLDLREIDIVLECSGAYKTLEQFQAFINAGAKKVLVSAPIASEHIGKTIVFGVNHNDLNKDDIIVSNASCTTNCLAPVAKVLDDNFGIENGFMTTIHAFTGDQKLVDGSHANKRRSRSAPLSIVPTSTGAAKALGLVLPRLKGRVDGVALRVPVANVSCVDLKVEIKKTATIDDVNKAFLEASTNQLKGVLAYEAQELVSVDFNHNSASAIFDGTQTMIMQGKHLRVCAWYDNEWGFSMRMLDVAKKMADTGFA